MPLLPAAEEALPLLFKPPPPAPIPLWFRPPPPTADDADEELSMELFIQAWLLPRLMAPLPAALDELDEEDEPPPPLGTGILL